MGQLLHVFRNFSPQNFIGSHFVYVATYYKWILHCPKRNAERFRRMLKLKKVRWESIRNYQINSFLGVENSVLIMDLKFVELS